MHENGPFRSYDMMMPVPMTPADRLALDLQRASAKTGFFSSLGHQIREANVTDAVEATNKKHKAIAEAVKSQTEVLNAFGELELATMRGRVQAEIGVMTYQVAREEGVMALQGRLAKAQEGMLIAQRGSLNAQYGLEATHRHKLLNFDLGAARKTAQLEETLAVVPEKSRRADPRNTMTLAEAMDLRAELTLGGKKAPQWLIDAINEAGVRSGATVVDD